jgi:UDP-glucose 4-epimerase
MKRCCIIGGTGFIGSYLVPLLQSSGRELTVIGRNSRPTRLLPEGVRYLSGDYGDAGFLAPALRSMDEVILLAYSSVPKTSFEHPIEDILTNLPAAVTLFRLAAEQGIAKCIFVSSGGTVYGKAECVPISEEHPTNPISPYGITKLAIEKYAHLYHELNSLPVVCVRPGNGYGAGQLPFVGQGFVATAIASILKGDEITLFGSGDTIRDYLHVSDMAGGITAALEKGIAGEIYNLGSGIGKTNQDVLAVLAPLAEEAGLLPRIRTAPGRRFDVPCNLLDPAKLKQHTGWLAAVPFEEGIRDTWQWYRRAYRGD